MQSASQRSPSSQSFNGSSHSSFNVLPYRLQRPHNRADLHPIILQLSERVCAGGGGNGGHQRAYSGAAALLLLHRLEGFFPWRPPHVWQGRPPVLHPGLLHPSVPCSSSVEPLFCFHKAGIKGQKHPICCLCCTTDCMQNRDGKTSLPRSSRLYFLSTIAASSLLE